MRSRAFAGSEIYPDPGEAARVALPLRLHADGVEELLERLPPLVHPPRFDARHVRAADPGARQAFALLAALHGVEPPELPVPADPLIAPLRIGDAAGAAALFEAVDGPAFRARLQADGWTPAAARRLGSVVGDLVHNALEHGGVPVWVAAWNTPPGELRIAVADAGPGFAASFGVPDEREAVLGVMLHGRARLRQAGRGLGLYRVAQRAAMWGGRVRVRSRTVLLSGAPPWNDAEVRDQLPFLPGVQVEVVVPRPAARPRRGAGIGPA